MERDVLIINKILQAAYQLRNCQWITAHTIRHHMGETLSISELKHFLGILCDRDLLKKVQETAGALPRRNHPGRRKTGETVHRTDLYRITERGIRSVQAGFKPNSNVAVFKRPAAREQGL